MVGESHIIATLHGLIEQSGHNLLRLAADIVVVYVVGGGGYVDFSIRRILNVKHTLLRRHFAVALDADAAFGHEFSGNTLVVASGNGNVNSFRRELHSAAFGHIVIHREIQGFCLICLYAHHYHSVGERSDRLACIVHIADLIAYLGHGLGYIELPAIA